MSGHIILPGANGDRVRINPARDIAHFWGQLASMAVSGLDDKDRWPASLRQVAEDAGVTGPEVVRAAVCFLQSLDLATRPGPEAPHDGLVRSAFLDCHPLAQAIVLLRVGQVSMGAWWHGIKDATVEGTVPACHEDLIRAGVSLAAALNETFKLLPGTTSP